MTIIMITLMMTLMTTTMLTMMLRSGGRSGASASRKPALLDRTKGGRQAEVAKVVIVIPVVGSIIIPVVTSIITILTRQEKRLALEEGLRRPPSQPLPSLRPLSQPPSLRSMPPSSSFSSHSLRPISGHLQLPCLGTHQLGSRQLDRNTSRGLPDRAHDLTE